MRQRVGKAHQTLFGSPVASVSPGISLNLRERWVAGTNPSSYDRSPYSRQAVWIYKPGATIVSDRSRTRSRLLRIRCRAKPNQKCSLRCLL